MTLSLETLIPKPKIDEPPAPDVPAVPDDEKDNTPDISVSSAHYWRVFYPATKTRRDAEALYESIYGEKPKLVFDLQNKTYAGPCPKISQWRPIDGGSTET